MKQMLLLFLTLLLVGCAPRTAPVQTMPPETTAAPTVPTTEPTVTEATIGDVSQEAEGLMEAPAPALPVILQCDAPGILEERGESGVIDYSNASDGYIMIRYFGTEGKRLKVRLSGPTTLYTYDLQPDTWTVFPLSDGSGSYRANIYRNTTGSRYVTVMGTSFQAELKDEFAPFLRPNQYVDYSNSPMTMETASLLCAGITDPLEKVAAVYEHVVTVLHYDEQKAATVTSGYLPVLDEVLASQTGICFDYAAVMAAMLRSQEVPCKLVVGYAGSIYHAWISVWTEENGWIDGVIFFDGKAWKRMDPTFASYGQRSEEIMEFIEHGNYTVKYLY